MEIDSQRLRDCLKSPRRIIAGWGFALKAPIALVLEDEMLIVLDVETHLAEAGFAVVVARSCEEANRFLSGHTPNLAIVDVELADGSCHAVAGTLLERNVPFIVHSGTPLDEGADVFRAGHFLLKPASMQKLVEIAKAMVEG
ncbi:response regulator [Mesorhizobium sp. B3-1-9]|uniref:response regulator n=1 Tax=unclassified Mesorhizobium TaxID=325217 RepID=UPI001128CA65|nr:MULTISPECIES: response regulator [unclassified Mesorhizobium]TPI36812.1 response regulator [Mesorhizobium sp. B3-1-9]